MRCMSFADTCMEVTAHRTFYILTFNPFNPILMILTIMGDDSDRFARSNRLLNMGDEAYYLEEQDVQQF